MNNNINDVANHYFLYASESRVIVILFQDLQYELARVCKAHNDLMRTYEAKLNLFGVPTEELGFKPLESTVGGQQLGQGPAGLVSAPM